MTTVLYTRIFVEMRSEQLCHTLFFYSLPNEMLASNRRLSRSLLTGIIGDDTIQVNKVFPCVKVDVIYADLRRTVKLVIEGFGTTPQSTSG